MLALRFGGCADIFGTTVGSSDQLRQSGLHFALAWSWSPPLGIGALGRASTDDDAPKGRQAPLKLRKSRWYSIGVGCRRGSCMNCALHPAVLRSEPASRLRQRSTGAQPRREPSYVAP